MLLRAVAAKDAVGTEPRAEVGYRLPRLGLLLLTIAVFQIILHYVVRLTILPASRTDLWYALASAAGSPAAGSIDPLVACGLAALVVIILLCSVPGLSPFTRVLLGEEDSE